MASSGDQVVLHLNSHGPQTRVPNPASANNAFTQLTTMPIRDINKIGVLQGKIPRQMDLIDATNNQIQFNITFANGTVRSYANALHLIDFYPSSGMNGGNVVDTPLAVVNTYVAANAPDVWTTSQSQPVVEMDTDAYNLAEMLQFTFNSARRIGGPNLETLRDDNLAFIVANSGRLTFALGRISNDVDGQNNAAYAHADNVVSQIVSLTFQMHKQVAFALGFPMMRNHGFNKPWAPRQRVSVQLQPGVGEVNIDMNNNTDDPFNPAGFEKIIGKTDADLHIAAMLALGNAVQTVDQPILKRGETQICPVVRNTNNMLFACAERPCNMRGPSTILLQIHTCGTKSRALGFDSEKACWALSVENDYWVSSRSNLGIRDCADKPISPANAAIVGRAVGIQNYMPYQLTYFGSWQNRADATDGAGSVFDWSFVTPQWQFTKTERVTIQDIQLSLYSGDTHEPLKVFSGNATEFTLIASP